MNQSQNNKDTSNIQEQKQVWNLRTLPREIIKWIQGLDLSYSVKDPRKDLNNGFLVAEILSRYYPRPGVLNMHSFDNSQNFSRRKNNWELLDLFFKKNDLPFQRNDWRKILMDNDAEAIIVFTQKLYQFLTQRKISKPPLANLGNTKEFLTGTLTDQAGTTSFLLKDKGLEKIEDNKEKEKEVADKDKKQLDGSVVQSEKKMQLSHASSKRTNFLRVPSKPISQNIESMNYQIDVKKLNVRQITGSVLDLKENKLLKDENQENFNRLSSQMNSSHRMNGQDKKDSTMIATKQHTQSTSQYGTAQQDMNSKKEKKLDSIMDIINTMLMDSLNRNSNELNKIKIKNNSIFQVFSDNIDVFEDEFVGTFLMDINHSMDAFLTYVQKDTNELWKFFNFMFTCLNNLDPKKESLKILVELIKSFGQKSVIKDAQKTKSIFVEFFLPQLAQYIKSCLVFEKKEMLFSIVYCFCQNDPISRHQMICSLKQTLDDQNIFMQALVVLIQYEQDFNGNNQLLLNDFKHFVRMNLLSPSTNLRTMSLAILEKIADIKYDIVLEIVLPKIDTISKNTWWENKCLAIIVFSKLIRGIINSEKYNVLIKNPQANQKFFSVENEKMVSEMKQQIVKLSQGIQNAALPAGSDYILSITFIYIVEHINESKPLLELFLQLILSCSDEIRHWVLYSYDPNKSTLSNRSQQSNRVNNEPAKNVEILNFNGQKQSQQGEQNTSGVQEEKDQYIYFVQSDKSLKYKNNINSHILRKYASDILMSLVQMIENLDLNTNLMTHEYMELISYCFQNTDFKVINVESCEKIANTLKEYIFLSLCDEELTAQAKVILEKLFELQFHADVKIKESELVFSSAISLIYENNFQKCIEQVEILLRWLIEDYRAGIENVKIFVNEVYKGLLQRKSQQYRQNKALMEILEPVIENFKKDENEIQNMEPQEGDELQQEEAEKIGHEESAINVDKGMGLIEGKEQSGIMEQEELSEILNAFQQNEKDLIIQAKKWTPESNYVVTLERDQIIPIPECGLDGLSVGLAWQQLDKIDLDSGLVMLDKNGKIIDQVSYMQLKSKDKSVTHRGDNTSGLKEGDDEIIDLKLKQVSPNVESMWLFVSIYSQNNKGFDSIINGKYRMSIAGQEFCTFNWKQAENNEYNGLIACDLSKKSGVWTVRARGYYCKNCPKLQQGIQIIEKVFQGDLSQIV